MDRPVGKLIRIVKANKQISEKGQEIFPLSQANEEIQEAWDDEEEEEALQDAPEEHPGQEDDVQVQEVQRHLPGSHSPLHPATQDQLQVAVDPGEQVTALPPQEGQGKETARDLIGLKWRDGEAIE